MEDLNTKIESLIKKIGSLEQQVQHLQVSVGDMGRADIHNFTLLDNKVDEKIKTATKEIIAAIEKR